MREYDGNDNVYIYIYTLYVNIIPLKGFENSKSDETFLYVDRGTAPSTPEKYEEFLVVWVLENPTKLNKGWIWRRWTSRSQFRGVQQIMSTVLEVGLF